MTNSPTASTTRDPDPIPFTPAPCHRHNGWTAERQRKFIYYLSQIGVVRAAAEAVGMSRKSAYHLRNRTDGKSFAEAWDAALEMGQDHANDLAITRAVDGYEVPYFYGGRQRGTIRRYDNRLLLASLAYQDRKAGD